MHRFVHGAQLLQLTQMPDLSYPGSYQTAGVQFQGSTHLSCQVTTELDNLLLYLECYRCGLCIVNPTSSATCYSVACWLLPSNSMNPKISLVLHENGWNRPPSIFTIISIDDRV
jgi:hypothetical protein